MECRRFKKNRKKLSTICTHISGEEKKAGALYNCYVNPGISYNFYVLTTPEDEDTTINLIMDRNICEDGTPTENGKTCLLAYNSSGNATGTGPVTAMTYLNNATSTWKNIDNLDLTYDDEKGNFEGFVLNGKARLPYRSEVTQSNGSNNYLYENLDISKWELPTNKPTNKISGIIGYWILSSSSNPINAAGVYSGGYISTSPVSYRGNFGVRPVINLKI